MDQSASKNYLFILIIALVGWFAVFVQLYLIILNRTASVPETIVRFFSFFTILTNILVAFTSTIIFINRKRQNLVFFQKPNTLTAVSIYILIVGLIYNIILRQLWKPTGMQRLVDELLHSVVPLLFVAYWFLFVSKKELQWKNLWAWLLYPLIYLIVVLTRGTFSGFYPYPFLDVNINGFSVVLINSLGITVLFIFFSLLLIGLGKRMSA